MDERRPAPPPSRRRDETLAVDPSDVRRHARRLRERDRPDPLRRLARYGALGLVVVALVAAYWNRETLLGIRVDASALTSLFAKRPAPGDPAAPGRAATRGVSNVEAPPRRHPRPHEPRCRRLRKTPRSRAERSAGTVRPAGRRTVASRRTSRSPSRQLGRQPHRRPSLRRSRASPPSPRRSNSGSTASRFPSPRRARPC